MRTMRFSLWLAVLCLSVSAVNVQAAVVTDTTGDAIQRALDAARPGQTVQLAADTTYRLDAPLAVPSGVTLAGAGHGTVLRSTHNGEAIIDLTNRSNATVRDLTLNGADGQNIYGVLAWAEGKPTVGGLSLTGLNIQNIRGNGNDQGEFGVFFAAGVTDSLIARNTIVNIDPDSPWSAGVRLAHGSTGNTVADNLVDTTGRGGILANDGSGDLVIRGNTVTRTGLAGDTLDLGLGIEVHTDVDRTVIEDNRVDRWLSVAVSDDVAVRRNVVGDGTGDVSFTGLELVDSERVIFSDNVVDGNAHLGISISGNGDTRHALFDNNRVEGATTFGVQVQGTDDLAAGGTAEKIYFHDNKILGTTGEDALYENTGEGYRENQNVGAVTLDGNVIEDADDRTGGGYAVNSLLISPTLLALGDTPGYTLVEGGQPITLEFAGLAGDVEFVLWDLGEGTPRSTNGTTLVPDVELEAGTLITAVGWDASGGASLQHAIVVVPEPAAAAALLIASGGLLALRRRDLRR